MTMDGSTTADQMLRSIQSEYLQQLLTSVQQKTKPPGPTGIPSFDAYFSSLIGEPTSISKYRPPLYSGDMIQIQGHPGSGKTHMLYFLVATCVMPLREVPQSGGGWAKAAFVLDIYGHFRISRLHAVLIDRLQTLSSPQSLESVVELCLERVHIFRPTSAEQLSATLAHLPKYHARNLPETDLGMIAIHSIDSFYWLDRFRAEQLRSAPPSGNVPKSILLILESLRSCYGFITVLIRANFVQQLESNSGVSRDLRTIHCSADTSGSIPHHQSAAPSASQMTLTSLLSNDGPQFAWQWTAQLDGTHHYCVITCEIKDEGVTMK